MRFEYLCAAVVLAILGLIAKAMLKDGRSSNDNAGLVLGVVVIILLVFVYALNDSANLYDAELKVREYLAETYLPPEIANPDDIQLTSTCIEEHEDDYCILWSATFEHLGQLRVFGSVTAQVELTENGYQITMTMDGNDIEVPSDSCSYVTPDPSLVQSCFITTMVANDVLIDDITFPEGECSEYNDVGYCMSGTYTSELLSRGPSYIAGTVIFSLNHIDEKVQQQ